MEYNITWLLLNALVFVDGKAVPFEIFEGEKFDMSNCKQRNIVTTRHNSCSFIKHIWRGPLMLLFIQCPNRNMFLSYE